MNLSEENTKELESYGVWVKNTSNENSTSSENVNSQSEKDLLSDIDNVADNIDLPDFDTTDFSDMFKDDAQFSTNDSQNDDFTSGLDSTLSTDELSNITDFADVSIEEAVNPEDNITESFTDETDKTDADTQPEENIIEENSFEIEDIPDFDTDLSSIDDEVQIPEEEISETEMINDDDSETISFDNEEEISLDDFMDEGFSDESVAAGNNGYEPGKEKTAVSLPTESHEGSDTEELSLDDFMDGDFEMAPQEVQSTKEEIVEEEPPLDMELSFDDSVENVETEENISVETYEDFDEDSVAVETEEVSLDDFGDIFDTPAEDNNDKDSSIESKSISMDETEEIDLSDFGIDTDAEETPINQDVEEAKKKDAVVDYDLFVGDENTSTAPIVNEIKSVEKQEFEKNETESIENKNTTSVDNSILQQIMAELTNLKNDINTLKSNIEEIKAEEASVKEEVQPAEKLIPEETKDEGGFFSGLDDDDTIALSFDELDNIMNTADFSGQSDETNEKEEPETSTESVIEDDAPLADETVLTEEPVLEDEAPLSDETILTEEPVLENDAPLADETVLTEEPVLEDDAPLADETVLTEEPVLEDDAPLADETVLTEEPVLEDETPLADETVLTEEPVLEDDAPLADETVLTEEPVLEDETPLSDETVLSENTVLEDNFDAISEDLEFDYQNENLEEPEMDNLAEINLDEDFEENDIIEEDLPDEISIPKEDIFVESNSQDFMDSVNNTPVEMQETSEDETLSDENPLSSESIDDDIPTVEKLLENQDAASILESDNEAFEKDLQEQQNTISEENPVISESEETSEDDFLDIANTAIFDEEPVIEETSVDLEQEEKSEEPVFDIFDNADTTEAPSETISDEIIIEETMPSVSEESEVKITEKTENQKPLSSDLMQDVKSLLVYMDQLLEDLPEEKIEEFANSDKFVLFKNVFEKLGLN